MSDVKSNIYRNSHRGGPARHLSVANPPRTRSAPSSGPCSKHAPATTGYCYAVLRRWLLAPSAGRVAARMGAFALISSAVAVEFTQRSPPRETVSTARPCATPRSSNHHEYARPSGAGLYLGWQDGASVARFDWGTWPSTTAFTSRVLPPPRTKLLFGRMY